MSKPRPRRHTKAHAKYYPGRRRGTLPIVERLAQNGLLFRAQRRLVRAARAVEDAPKGERKARQAFLAGLRERLVMSAEDAGGATWFVRVPMSKRR